MYVCMYVCMYVYMYVCMSEKAKAKGKAACKRPAAERTSCWLESKSFGLVKKTVQGEGLWPPSRTKGSPW